MQIFARMTKVDEASRTVTGVIANEALDRSGEIFDYASSKPHFEKWSGDIAKSTDGKSVGNVRAMHGNIAAGVVKQMDMDDVAKAISVNAHIVDDNEWAKVQAGVYSGFSIGGKYARKWKGDDGLQRYTAEPCEVSLVDLPCNPDAQFSVIKADGSEELRKFDVPAAKDYTAQAERLSKHADAESTGNVILAVMGKPTIEKGLWTVATFADVLQQLSYMADDAAIESAAEGDNSKVPAQLKAALKPLVDAFLAMAAEEVAEAIKGDDTEVIELAASGDLAKAGARHSAKDKAAIEALAKHHAAAKKHLAAMDDHMASLNSAPPKPDADGDDAQKLAKAADDLQKVVAERDELAGKLEKVTAQYAELLTKAAPPKGSLRAVTKDADASDAPLNKVDDSPVLNKDGSIDHAETALKMMKIVHKR
ncbi:MAG: hypothetical protein KGH75_12475 [Rhodospirillales bacterium]|nr:hypothetical protein [Rhodospirillales bacterium]